MQNKLCCGIIGLAMLAGVHPSVAQGTRYFRISGPAATRITALRADGSLVWTNALAGTNYIVQTASSLAGGTNWVSYVQLSVTNRLNTNQVIAFNPPSGMALIPAGSFTMGDVADTNIDGHAAPITVYVSAFYMDRTDVTYSQWQTVYSWAIAHGYNFDYAGSGKAANHPVQTIDWYDCVKWCNARSEMAGLAPAYYTTAAQTTVYRTGEIDLANGSVNWGAGYRLPTEAEWEKAARGGLSGQRFPWGDTISWSQANYYGYPLSLTQYGFAYDFATAIDHDPAFSGGDSGAYPYTSPVNYFAPNGYGLYDMAGNVFQWCWDWYGTYAGGSDPRGPVSGSFRVLRGGDWDGNAYGCRTARRISISPGYDGYYLGFRSVLSPGQ